MIEVAESGDLGDLGQGLGNEEHSVRLDLLELHFEVESCPEEGISAELMEPPAYSGHAVQILRESIDQISSDKHFFPCE